MSNKELKYSFEDLKSAYVKLEEGVLEKETELVRDAVIKRFEFTYELLWKTIKIFLEVKGIKVKFPRDCFLKAFKYGWIKNESIVLKMLEDRNKTTHICSAKDAQSIYEVIKIRYKDEISNVIQVLENVYKEID